VFVTEVQRARLLDATVAVVSELGYKQMTVRRVSGRAGVSNKTFYDLFENREDCFLAAFDQAVERLAAVVTPAYESEGEWAARIRTGLGALLAFLDREAALSSLVFIEALGAGPRVLARRAGVLEDLGNVIDEGRAGVKAGRGLPPLTAEGVVGAAFSVIHARLLEDQPGSLTALLNPLMATIVLPYRGHIAATRELKYPISKAGPRTLPAGLDLLPADKSAQSGRPGERPDPARFRPTQRTQMVLSAVAEYPGASNREVSDVAQVMDQGQISKLLARLEGVGLITNTGGHTQGVPNAWHLTSRGKEIVSLSSHRGVSVPSVSQEETVL
jgi:AcrR family transcriptional regulator